MNTAPSPLSRLSRFGLLSLVAPIGIAVGAGLGFVIPWASFVPTNSVFGSPGLWCLVLAVLVLPLEKYEYKLIWSRFQIQDEGRLAIPPLLTSMVGGMMIAFSLAVAR
jgi:hypothetical protein